MVGRLTEANFESQSWFVFDGTISAPYSRGSMQYSFADRDMTATPPTADECRQALQYVRDTSNEVRGYRTMRAVNAVITALSAGGALFAMEHNENLAALVLAIISLRSHIWDVLKLHPQQQRYEQSADACADIVEEFAFHHPAEANLILADESALVPARVM